MKGELTTTSRNSLNMSPGQSFRCMAKLLILPSISAVLQHLLQMGLHKYFSFPCSFASNAKYFLTALLPFSFHNNRLWKLCCTHWTSQSEREERQQRLLVRRGWAVHTSACVYQLVRGKTKEKAQHHLYHSKRILLQQQHLLC